MNIEKNDIQQIKALLTAVLHVDFFPYKNSTVMRRVEKRMKVFQFTETKEYVDYLEQHEEEINILGKDIFINVTDFFRDPHVFQKIKNKILTSLFTKNKEAVKIWVAGCATGEEAYSFAILVKEFCEENGYKHKIKIIATDIKEEAINKARQGLYTLKDILGINQERLRKFFDREGDKYRIKKQIRSEVIFAIHDMTSDPPFARVDLLSCRNLLIYLDKENQKKVLSNLAFALNIEGFLVLGKSETAIDLSYELKNISSVYKIYKRIKSTRTTRRLNFDISYQDSLLPILIPPNENEAGMKEHELAKSFQQVIHQKYAPAVVIIDEQFYVKHITRSAKQYIDTPEDFTKIYSLLDLAPEAITAVVRAAIAEIKKGKKRSVYPMLPVTYAEVKQLSVTVEPLEVASDGLPFYAILFEENRSTDKSSKDIAKRINLALQNQLADTEENLRKTIGKLENTNQNLLASNEELQSTNEEYISVNEELQTINSEYQDTINELSISNKDVDHLLQSTDIGTLFLDDKLHIRKFTNSIKNLINIDDIDLKRPLKNFTHNLKNINIYKEVKAVLDSNQAIEKDVVSDEDIHYLMRATPYDVDEEDRRGIVLSFVDIQQLKDAEKALSESEMLYRSVFDYANDGIMLYNRKDEKIVTANKRHLEIMGYTDKQKFLALSSKDIFAEVQTDGEKLIPKVKRYRKINESKDLLYVEWTMKRQDGTLVETEINTVRMPNPYEGYFLHIVRDITQRKKAQAEILASQKRFEAIFDLSATGISIADNQFNIIRVNKAFAQMTGYTPKQLSQMTFSNITYHEDRKFNKNIVEQLKSGKKKVVNFEKRYVKKNGDIFWARLWVSILDDSSGEKFYLANIRDITKEKQAADALNNSEVRYRSLFEKNIDAVVIYDLKNNKIVSANKRACQLFECSKKYLIEHTPMDFFPEFQENGEPSTQFFGKQIQSQAQTGRIHHFMQLQTKKGKRIEAEITAFRLYDSPDSEMVVQFRNITTQKNAQKALKSSEQYFRSLFENSADALAIMDSKTLSIIDCNEYSLKLFRAKKKEVIGLNAFKFSAEIQIDGRPKSERLKEITNIVNEKGYHLIEKWVSLRPDGTEFYSEFSVTRLPAPDEHIYILQIRDITEKLQAQQAMQESEQRFRNLFENSAVGIGVFDIEKMVVIDCNLKFAQLHGMSIAQFKKTQPQDITAEIQADGRDSMTHLKEQIEAVMKNGSFTVNNWLCKRKDNTIFHAQVTLNILNENTPNIVFVHMYDVTERHQAQQAIRESEERFRSLFEHSADAVTIIDTNTFTFLDTNKKSLEMFGYSKEEMMTKTPKDLSTALQADGRTTSKHLKELTGIVKKQGYYFSNNWMNKRADGTEFYSEASVTNLSIPNDHIFIIQRKDITERRRVQQEIERINAILANADDIIGLSDAITGQLIYLNPAGRQKLGLRETRDVLSYNITDFHPKPAFNILEKEILPYLKKHKIWKGETYFVNKITQQEFLTSQTIIGHFDNTGELQYISCIARDITQQKKQENQLRGITTNIAAAYDDDWFDAIVKSIADNFQITGCSICKPIKDKQLDEIVSMYSDGKYQTGQLPLEGTPCLKIYNEGTQIYTKDVQQLYPVLDSFFDPPLQSYIGVPIYNSKNQITAYIAAFDTKIIENTDFIQTTLQIYASRIGAELERAEKEKVLQQQKDYLNTIINLTPSMITAKDTQGNFILANQAATAIYGVTLEKLIGKNRKKFDFGFGAEKSLTSDKKVIESGEIQQYDNAILSMANGDKRVFQIIKVPLRNDDGAVIQVLAVATDITELKQIERDLRESETKFKAIFENSHAIISILDKDGMLIEQNRLLLSDSQLNLGKPVWESRWFTHDKKIVAEVKRDLKKIVKGKTITKQFIYKKTPDIGYISCTTKPIYADNGKDLLFLLAETREITEFVKSQQVLAQKVDELNHKNEELKKYIDSNMQLENFAYITSHDLREPLRTISGFANLLERKYLGKLDETADEYLGYILTSTKNMNALIEDLLIFSRVHTGEHKVEEIQLNNLLEQITKSIGISIQETDAKIQFKNIPKTINANETKMKQLFQNLISNAIKFRKQDTPPEVIISAKSKGKFWEFTIQDNGIGIKEDYYDKIFMIFKRLHTKDEYEGTGIGLSLCKKIVEQHGGKIHLESTLGEGATFYFTLEK